MWFWEGGDCGEVIFTVKRKIFTYPQSVAKFLKDNTINEVKGVFEKS